MALCRLSAYQCEAERQNKVLFRVRVSGLGIQGLGFRVMVISLRTAFKVCRALGYRVRVDIARLRALSVMSNV